MEKHGEIRHSKFKRICVFCGSSPGKKPSYQDAAIELGNELVCIVYINFSCFSLFPTLWTPIFFSLFSVCLPQMFCFCVYASWAEWDKIRRKWLNFVMWHVWLCCFHCEILFIHMFMSLTLCKSKFMLVNSSLKKMLFIVAERLKVSIFVFLLSFLAQ